MRAGLIALLLALAGALAAPGASAQPTRKVGIGLLYWPDDPRFEERRLERQYPGQSAGPPLKAVAVGLDESDFALQAAGVEIVVEPREVADLDAARQAVAAFAAAGAPALIVDLPPDWLAALATTPAGASAPLLFNVSASDDELRGKACHPRVFHTAPSERMLTDAVAQYLAVRKWRQLLVLQGPTEADARLGRAFAQSARKFALKIGATRPFKVSNDPRERDLGNVQLLTSNADYEAVIVHDAEGEFARLVPYQSILPRPVLGSNGLVPVAWHHHLERYGAPQLSSRFQKAARRPMQGSDWSAWVAMKAIAAVLVDAPAADAAALRKALRSDQLILDGFKGKRLNFRPWDQQLRQPVMLSYGDFVAGLAPFEGFLHQRDTLDTIGADEPETACKMPG